MPDFAKDDFVKVVGVNGDFSYGYIHELTEEGYHLHVCLHEEGDSAVEYEKAAGSLVADWDKMLSDTERGIINWLSRGYSTRDIADEISLAPSTVRTHIRMLRLKLQLDNRQQLVAFAQGLNKKLEEGS